MKQEVLNGIKPMRPPSAHRSFRNNPTAKRVIKVVSVLVSGISVSECSAKLSPDFPAGFVRFLLVDALPLALGLDGFKIAVVGP